MRLSERSSCVGQSLTREFFMLAQRYGDVIDLTLGDPDVPPLQDIKDAGCAAIQAGKTRYSANAGLAELRDEIASMVAREYGIEFDPASEVLVSSGGMGALHLALMALVNPGDEVVVQGPTYVNYIQMVKMCGGVPVVVDSSLDEGFVAPVSRYRDAITSRTVALVVNSPCNPTGVAYGPSTLDGLASLAEEFDLAVISDEVYRTLLYDGMAHESVITRPGMRGRAVLVDSASKRFAMTGYRVGYLCAPAELVGTATAFQENIIACASLPAQYAALEAYRERSEDTALRDVFERRRNCLLREAAGIPQLRFLKPQGAFYLFADVGATGLDGLDFARGLLQSQHVAVVPGVAYGAAYGDYIRIAYTLDLESIREAVRRIGTYVHELTFCGAPSALVPVGSMSC